MAAPAHHYRIVTIDGLDVGTCCYCGGVREYPRNLVYSDWVDPTRRNLAFAAPTARVNWIDWPRVRK